MTHYYNRSELFSFWDIPTQEQNDLISMYGEDIQEDTFVVSRHKEIEEFLPLSQFIRLESNFSHGVYSLSYFSAFFITFNRSNDEAVISYKSF